MTHPLNAEIIAIGTEILLGELTDTNSVYLARVLRDMGINLYFMTSVGDNEGRIADAIQIALGRADIIITCGGLGPTVDDMTRQAVATATQRGLTFHQRLLDQIAERFAGFNAQMTENNKRQAYVPDDAVIIDNPVGTAPSFVVEVGEKVVLSLPGVPREMKYLMIEKIVPYLRAHYQLTTELIKAHVLKVAGIGESALDEMIGTDILTGSNPTVGLNAHSGQVDVRITAKALTEAEADAMIRTVEERLRDRIGYFIYGTNTDTLEAALLSELQQNGATLSLWEAGVTSEVSGRMMKLIGENSLMTVQNYATPAVLINTLGWQGEQPLRTSAERTAALVGEQPRAAGIAILSFPDNAEDRADVSALTAIAVTYGGKTHSRSYGFGADSEPARSWTATWTMAMLWRMLKESRTS